MVDNIGGLNTPPWTPGSLKWPWWNPSLGGQSFACCRFLPLPLPPVPQNSQQGLKHHLFCLPSPLGTNFCFFKREKRIPWGIWIPHAWIWQDPPSSISACVETEHAVPPSASVLCRAPSILAAKWRRSSVVVDPSLFLTTRRNERFTCIFFHILKVAWYIMTAFHPFNDMRNPALIGCNYVW